MPDMALIIINAETMHLFKALERMGGRLPSLSRRALIKNSSIWREIASAPPSDTPRQKIPSPSVTGLDYGDFPLSLTFIFLCCICCIFFHSFILHCCVRPQGYRDTPK